MRKIRKAIKRDITALEKRKRAKKAEKERLRRAKGQRRMNQASLVSGGLYQGGAGGAIQAISAGKRKGWAKRKAPRALLPVLWEGNAERARKILFQEVSAS